ncbi:hypothetical protein P9112_001793 [Eukaryota sp. TZLM1-RC]
MRVDESKLLVCFCVPFSSTNRLGKYALVASRILFTLLVLVLIILFFCLIVFSPRGGWFYRIPRKQKLQVYGVDDEGNFQLIDLEHNSVINGHLEEGYLALSFLTHTTSFYSGHKLPSSVPRWLYENLESKTVCVVETQSEPLRFPSLLQVNESFDVDSNSFFHPCRSYSLNDDMTSDDVSPSTQRITHDSTLPKSLIDVCLKNGLIVQYRVSGQSQYKVPNHTFTRQKQISKEPFDTHVDRFCEDFITQEKLYEAVQKRDGQEILRVFDFSNFRFLEVHEDHHYLTHYDEFSLTNLSGKRFTIDHSDGSCSSSSVTNGDEHDLLLKNMWLSDEYESKNINGMNSLCFSKHTGNKLCVDKEHGYTTKLCISSNCSTFSEHKIIGEDDNRLKIPHYCE